MTGEELNKVSMMLNQAGYSMHRLEDIPLNVLRPCASELSWGTFGISGNEPLQHKPISELATSHLRNILVTQSAIPPLVKAVVVSVYEDRIKSGLEWPAPPAEEPEITELTRAEILLNSLLGEDDAQLV